MSIQAARNQPSMEQGDCEDLSEASSGTDASSYASSFDEEASQEGRSTPDASPRLQGEPASCAQGLPTLSVPPTAGQLSPKRMPKPRIPALGLRPEKQRGPGSATPRSQPESARGRPGLAIPRLPTAPRPCEDAAMDRPAHDEAPVTARLAACAGQGAAARPACASDRCDGLGVPASMLTVGLLSPALTMNSKQGDLEAGPLAAQVLSRVGQALGVQQRELTLFEVRELPTGAQPSSDATCLAVAVSSSGTLCFLPALPCACGVRVYRRRFSRCITAVGNPASVAESPGHLRRPCSAGCSNLNARGQAGLLLEDRVLSMPKGMCRAFARSCGCTHRGTQEQLPCADFSLGALERLLSDSARLRAEADAAAAQLDSARRGRHSAEALAASLRVRSA